MAVACAIGSIPAAAFASYQIESIIGSGPLLLVAAILLTVLARPVPLRQLWIISGAVMAIVVGIFLWITLTGMGPADARVPVGRATIAAAMFLQLGWLPIYLVYVQHRSRQ